MNIELIALALPLIAFCVVKPKWFFHVFFLWILAEGVLRKWVFPGSAAPLFFLKYVLLLGPIIPLIATRVRMEKKHYPYMLVLLLYLAWGIFEIFNYRATDNWQVKVLGLLIHFAFIPFLILVPKILNTKERISSLLFLIAYSCLPVFVLGVYQHYAGQSSTLNLYVGEGRPAAIVGDFVRITGVFSFITTYTSYLVFVLMVLLYLVLIVKMSRGRRIFLCALIGLGVVNFTMTGSRGAFFVFVLQAWLFTVLFLFSRSNLKQKFIVRAGTIVVLLVILFIYTQTGRDSAAAFMGRISSNDDMQGRLIDNYTPLKFINEAGLIGYGIGTTYQGASGLEESWRDMPRDFEQEWERLLLELGLTGFLLIMILRLQILFFSFKTFRGSVVYENRFLLAVIFISQVPTVLGLNSIVFNYMDNIYYWFFIGLLVSLNRLEKKEASPNISSVQAA